MRRHVERQATDQVLGEAELKSLLSMEEDEQVSLNVGTCAGEWVQESENPRAWRFFENLEE